MGGIDMVQFSLVTPLGIPVQRNDFDISHRELERTGGLKDINRPTVRQVIDALLRDASLQANSGRWNPGRPDPDQFVPGDVAAIRAVASDSIVMGVGAISLERARTLHLRSKPSGDLDLVSDREGLLVQFDPSRLLGQPFAASLLVDLDRFGVVGELIARGGHLSGLVLLADDDGHLRDDVIWLVAANPRPEAPWPASLDRIRGLVRGFRSAATLAPLVTNVAAAVAWAVWRDPPPTPDLPSDPTPRQLRKALKRNSVRVRERQGALVGVRMLDLARNAARGTRTEREGPSTRRASPIPHMRSGHFRNVRVGPRDDFHYEPRWIPPTWVRGDLHSTDQRVVVRRVPPPDTWTRRDLHAGDHRVRDDLPEAGRVAPGSPGAAAAGAREPTIPPLPHDDPFEPGLG